MDKEMKKLLLVAVSVGVFLLVAITVSLIILTPKAQTQETAFSSSVPYSSAKPVPDIMSNMPEQINTNPALTGVTPATVNITENGRPEVIISSDRNNGDRLTIQVPRPTSAAIPETTQTATSSTPATRTQRQNVQPAATQVTRTQPAATTRTQTSASTSRTSTSAARNTSSKTINDYWIQTGAFSAIVRAEDARETLATNGLISIIENRIIDGKTLYRVRLGPYTSEREANHWLTIVKAIDGFGESQVRQTIRAQ